MQVDQMRAGILHFNTKCYSWYLFLMFSVLPVLHQLMTPSSPPAVYEQALRCYSSWVQFGIPLTDGESLVLQAFHALGDESVFDTAVDALVSVFSHQENHRYFLL